MEDNLSENLRKAVALNNTVKTCECGVKMSYDPVKGLYTCPVCHKEEQDMYGFLKEVLEEYPMLNKYDLARLLEIPLRVLNEYFENGVLKNPNRTY